MRWCDTIDKTSDGRHKKRDGGTSSKLDEQHVDGNYRTFAGKYMYYTHSIWA